MILDTITSKNDECYTPVYAVKPIAKYLKPRSTVWCPFDTDESYFVKYLRSVGHTVVNTHLEMGKDFFQNYEQCDYIISNPPYSLKTQVLDRLFFLDKPFAMLLGVVGLFESQKRFDLFKTNDFEVMYLNRRVSYFNSFEDQTPKLNPPFSSVYLCHNVLPKQIVFEEIDKKDF